MMPVDHRQQDVQQPISDHGTHFMLRQAFFGPQPPRIHHTGHIFDLPPELAPSILVVWNILLLS